MSVFIIAEAGSNWYAGPDESDVQRLERATQLIDVAADAGADACKFQLFTADSLYAKDTDNWRAVKPLEMPPQWLRILASHCERRSIEFMCSAFSPSLVDVVDPFVRRHKIASLEITDESLLLHVAARRKPVLVSTGVASPDQIAIAVALLKDVPMTLLHCVTAYPCPPEQLNLQVMMVLGITASGWLSYGLSDHTADPVVAPVMAAAMGASVIEKHFTLSRSLDGPDHSYALEPTELTNMVKSVRLAESMLGVPLKQVQPAEKQWLSLRHVSGGVRGGQ